MSTEKIRVSPQIKKLMRKTNERQSHEHRVRHLTTFLEIHVAPQAELKAAAARGDKFQAKGRGKGPFRKRIDALLKKNPAMKNPELWAEIAKKPPQGWVAMDNRAGMYFERQNPADGRMESFDYTTFCKRASEARKSLK